jgi:uncharacterized protein YuzE
MVRAGTFYIELWPTTVAEAWNLVESTLIELDTNSGICAITVKHASERSEVLWFSSEQIAAHDY